MMIYTPIPLLSLFKMLPTLREDPIVFFDLIKNKYGKIAMITAGCQTVFFVSEPAMVRHILLTKNDLYSKDTFQYRKLAKVTGKGLLTNSDDWKEKRSILQPPLIRSKVSDYAGKIEVMAKARVEAWAQDSLQNSLDMEDAIMVLTLEILASTVLGINLSQTATWMVKDMKTILDYLVDSMKNPASLQRLFSRNTVYAYQTSKKRLLDYVNLLIEEKMLFESSEDNLLNNLTRLVKNGQLTISEVRDELVTMLIAGHETVASALVWSLWLLSQHPAIEDKLRVSFQSQHPSCHDSFSYTTQVFNETLRLYPPAWIITRKAVSEDKLENFIVPAGSLMVIPVSTLHHDPDYWEAPHVFFPERFEKGDKHFIKGTYLPFGMGFRICIGNYYAMLEAWVILKSIYERYTFIPDDTKKEVEAQVTQRPRGGLMGKIRPVTL